MLHNSRESRESFCTGNFPDISEKEKVQEFRKPICIYLILFSISKNGFAMHYNMRFCFTFFALVYIYCRRESTWKFSKAEIKLCRYTFDFYILMYAIFSSYSMKWIYPKAQSFVAKSGLLYNMTRQQIFSLTLDDEIMR